jgi:hypothetical protein
MWAVQSQPRVLDDRHEQISRRRELRTAGGLPADPNDKEMLARRSLIAL